MNTCPLTAKFRRFLEERPSTHRIWLAFLLRNVRANITKNIIGTSNNYRHRWDDFYRLMLKIGLKKKTEMPCQPIQEEAICL